MINCLLHSIIGFILIASRRLLRMTRHHARRPFVYSLLQNLTLTIFNYIIIIIASSTFDMKHQKIKRALFFTAVRPPKRMRRCRSVSAPHFTVSRSTIHTERSLRSHTHINSDAADIVIST